MALNRLFNRVCGMWGRYDLIIVISKGCCDWVPWAARNPVIRALCQSNNPEIQCGSAGITGGGINVRPNSRDMQRVLTAPLLSGLALRRSRPRPGGAPSHYGKKVPSNKARGYCCRRRPLGPIAAEACSPAVFTCTWYSASRLPEIRGRACPGRKRFLCPLCSKGTRRSSVLHFYSSEPLEKSKNLWGFWN
jgi:hypothetical protein